MRVTEEREKRRQKAKAGRQSRASGQDFKQTQKQRREGISPKKESECPHLVHPLCLRHMLPVFVLNTQSLPLSVPPLPQYLCDAQSPKHFKNVDRKLLFT